MLVSSNDIGKIREIIEFFEGIRIEVDDLYSNQWPPSTEQSLIEYRKVLNFIYSKYNTNETHGSPMFLLLKDAVNRVRFIIYEKNLRIHNIEENIDDIIDYLNNFLYEFNLFVVHDDEIESKDNIRDINGLGVIKFSKEIANKFDIEKQSPIETANRLIKNNDIEEAISYLLKYTQEKKEFSENHKEFLLISSRFKDWKDNNTRGITNESIKNQIVHNILELVDTLKKKIEELRHTQYKGN